MKFERNGWTILLNEDKDITEDGRQAGQLRFFQTVFHSGVRNQKECETFTVKLKDTEIMLAQVILYPDGNTATYSYVPTIINTDLSKKTVELDMLCNFRVAGQNVYVMSMENGSEYDLTAFWEE